MANKPVHKISSGVLKVAIWANSSDKGTFYSVTASRSYKDGDTWKDSDSFGADDLLRMAKLFGEADTWIQQQPKAKRPAADDQAAA